MSGCLGRTVPEPLILGHLVSLTGPDQVAGEASRQAIELQLSRMNEDLSSSTGRPVLVFHVDSRGDPKTVTDETVRLITVNRVAGLIGSLKVDLADRLVKQAQTYNIPVALTGETTAGANHDGIWQFNVSAASRGKALANWVEEKKFREVAIAVETANPACTALAGEFTRVLSKNNQVRCRELQWKSWKDISQAVTPALNQPKPDALLLAVSSAAIVKAGDTSAELKIPILYGGEDEGELPGSINPNETFLLATVVCPEGLTTAGKDFVQLFGKKFDPRASLFQVVQSADALRLLVELIPRNKSQSILKPREKLTLPDPFQGMTGKITFRGRLTDRPLYFLEQNGGKTRYLGQTGVTPQEP